MLDPKRSAWRALTLLAVFACAAVAACNAILQNGPATYVQPDTGIAESGGRDASGTSFDGWCAIHHLMPLCADFDEHGWGLNDAGQLFPPLELYPMGFSYQAGLTPEAGMALSDAAVSAPFAFQSSRATSADEANFSFVSFLGSDNPTLPQRVTLSFDLSVVSGCWEAFVGSVSITQSARLTFGLALAGLEVRPYVQAGGTATKKARTFVALSSLPLPDAGFARVTLGIDFVQSVLDLSVSVEGAFADASLESTLVWTDASSWMGGGANPPALEAGAPVSFGATGNALIEFGTTMGVLGASGFGGQLSDAGSCIVRIDNAWAASQTDGD
jgi:hypothetical protein